MEILHKRTTNNENTLIENLSEGELGLVLSENTEDTKIVLKNNSGGIEEIYTKSHPINCGEWKFGYEVGDILYHNSTNNKYTVSPEINSSLGLPIGIVAVPTSHNLYGDGSCGIISINFMRCDNPENGGNSQDVCWGYQGNDIVSLTNHDKVLLNDNNTENGGGHLASSKFTSNQIYGGQYGYSTLLYQIISIYDNDGNKNAIFLDGTNANVLKDVDGKANTDVLTSLSTAQADWKTAATITNNNGSGFYPAACCCRRYNPNGTTSGKWYLPSACELAYVMSKYNEINDKLTQLGTENNAYPLNNILYWSSSEFNSSYSWLLNTNNGGLGYDTKSKYYSARSFIRFKGCFPL